MKTSSIIVTEPTQNVEMPIETQIEPILALAAGQNGCDESHQNKLIADDAQMKSRSFQEVKFILR